MVLTERSRVQVLDDVSKKSVGGKPRYWIERKGKRESDGRVADMVAREY